LFGIPAKDSAFHPAQEASSPLALVSVEVVNEPLSKPLVMGQIRITGYIYDSVQQCRHGLMKNPHSDLRVSAGSGGNQRNNNSIPVPLNPSFASSTPGSQFFGPNQFSKNRNNLT